MSKWGNFDVSNFSDKFLKITQINMQIVEKIREFFQFFKIIN